MTTARSDRLVDTVVARVVRRTGAAPELVTAVVEHELTNVAHARVAAFLPILVERAALQRLHEMSVERQVETGDDPEGPHGPSDAALTAWREDSWMV